jgi:hypothetical protein
MKLKINKIITKELGKKEIKRNKIITGRRGEEKTKRRREAVTKPYL